MTPRDQKKAIDDLVITKVGGADYFVDNTNGSDSNDGLSWKTAKKTIQSAIDEAESWSSIWIKAGTYNEELNISTSNLSLIGETRTLTSIVPTGGTGSTTVFIDADYISIQSMEITVENYGYGIYLKPRNNILIKDIKLIEVSGAASNFGIFVDQTRYSIIKEIYSSADISYGIDFTGTASKSSKYNQISNCYLSCRHSIFMPNYAEENLIFNNYISNSAVSGLDLNSSSVIKNKIFHNIFVDNALQVNDNGVSNIFFENHFSDYTTDTNNDGICDSSYAIAGSASNYDYKPVSYPYAWLSAFHR